MMLSVSNVIADKDGSVCKQCLLQQIVFSDYDMLADKGEFMLVTCFTFRSLF